MKTLYLPETGDTLANGATVIDYKLSGLNCRVIAKFHDEYVVWNYDMTTPAGYTYNGSYFDLFEDATKYFYQV